MTSWKLIPMLAAAAFAGAVLADDLPSLPRALKLAQSADSPGVVTFNHDMHVDSRKPACTSCHPSAFRRLLGAGRAANRLGAGRCDHRSGDRTPGRLR